MYGNHVPRSIVTFQIHRPNYLGIVILSSNQTSRRGIPPTNRELKIVDPRITYHIPRTYIPETFVTVRGTHTTNSAYSGWAGADPGRHARQPQGHSAFSALGSRTGADLGHRVRQQHNGARARPCQSTVHVVTVSRRRCRPNCC